MPLNQEQMLSLLRTSLQVLGTYIVAHSTLGSDSAHIWELISGLVMVAFPTVWSMFAHSDAALVKNVTNMPEVAQVVKAPDAPADSAVAKLAADPTQPKVS